MRLKYYLRGLGLGILVTTLLFMISIRIHGGIMTDERAVARAKELGMVIPQESASDTQTPEDTQQPEDTQAPEDTQIPEDTQQPEDTQAPEDTQQPEDSQIPENTQQAGDGQPEETPAADAQEEGQDAAPEEFVVFTVADGEVCRTAAEKLVACGLLTEVDSFREYMKKMDYDGLIREGTYRIPVGSDMETIAKIITAQVPEAMVDAAASEDAAENTR